MCYNVFLNFYFCAVKLTSPSIPPVSFLYLFLFYFFLFIFFFSKEKFRVFCIYFYLFFFLFSFGVFRSQRLNRQKCWVLPLRLFLFFSWSSRWLVLSWKTKPRKKSASSLPAIFATLYVEEKQKFSLIDFSFLVRPLRKKETAKRIAGAMMDPFRSPNSLFGHFVVFCEWWTTCPAPSKTRNKRQRNGCFTWPFSFPFSLLVHLKKKKKK